MEGKTKAPATATGPDANRPEIIVVGKGEAFAPGTMDYALGVAERLGADVLAVTVNTLPELDEDAGPDGALRFATASAASTDGLRRRAREQGITFRHFCRTGQVSQVLSDVLHEHRHVSFVLAEADVDLAVLTRRLPVPVFAVNGADGQRPLPGTQAPESQTRTFGAAQRNNEKKGVLTMADTNKKQARSKALLFGVLSAAIYGAVFGNSDLVMDYFTRGGFYNVLPVITVIAVSYIHGSFASNVWTALGVNASSKVTTARKEAPARPTPRPRARMQA